MSGPNPYSLSAIRGARIAQLIECDGPGGAERVVALLSSGLREAGCEVVAFLPAAGEGWLGAELAAAAIDVEYLHLDRPMSWALAQQLTAALHRRRIDIAHSHEFTMACLGTLAARRSGIPHLFTMHGGRYHATRLSRRLALRAAAALGCPVAVSSTVADALRHDVWLRRPVHVIPNGVRWTPPTASTLRVELGLAAEDRLVLAIGNLYPVKGHVVLLDALAQLATTHPQLHVAIAGRGELRPVLAAQARRSGLATRVHLLGLRSDVPNLLAAADVVVHPSFSEGLPLALLEAMFAGKPIVASATGDIPAALDNGKAGLLVPPGSAAGIAAAIATLLGSPVDAAVLGAAARDRAARVYGVATMLERYASLYHELLSGDSRTARRAGRHDPAPSAASVWEA